MLAQLTPAQLVGNATATLGMNITDLPEQLVVGGRLYTEASLVVASAEARERLAVAVARQYVDVTDYDARRGPAADPSRMLGTVLGALAAGVVILGGNVAYYRYTHPTHPRPSHLQRGPAR